MIAVVAAAGYHVRGGRDSDTGAISGARAGERQSPLRMRAQSRALLAGTVAALVGYMAAAALRDPAWPFALIPGTEAVTFIAGLTIYRAREH